MRWFTTEEVCEILSRFEKVIVVGDSMMRHIIGSINVLIRKDLGYGAVTDWNFSPEERYVYSQSFSDYLGTIDFGNQGNIKADNKCTEEIAFAIFNSTSKHVRFKGFSKPLM